MTHHLVGMAEIAEMLGVSRQRVAQLIESYDDFPAPEVELTAGRIWSRTAIETWIHNHPDRGPGRREKEKKGVLGGLKEKAAGLSSKFSFQRFTDRARASIVKAQEEARLLKHNYIGTEHLLAGLVHGEGIAHDVLDSAGVTLDVVRDQIREVIGEGPETPQGHIPFTPRAKQALELALKESLDLGHNYIGTEHILLGLISEGEGVAWQILERKLRTEELRTSIGKAIKGGLQQAEGKKQAGPGLMFGGAGAPDVTAVHPETCGFCGKSSEEVQTLVAGPGPLRICNECVAGAMEIVGEAEGKTALETKLADLERRLDALEDDESA
jgi:predicted DNA-binding transcriptional regulator AlpA